MAFEIPLEADQVNDFNIFSSILGGPIIGTLQWIFGGKSDRNDYEDDNSKSSSPIDDSEEELDSDTLAAKSSCRMFDATKCSTLTLKKMSPSLIGSELSDIGEVRTSFDSMYVVERMQGGSDRFVPQCLKNKKSLSWSDEIGKGLVVEKVSC